MSCSLDPTYTSAFIEATRDVFNAMLETDVSFGPPVTGPAQKLCNDVSAMMGMTGEVTGAIVLSFPIETATRVAEAFVGRRVQTNDDQFAEAIAELVVMIGGAAKSRFHGRSVQMSCPSIIIGLGHHVRRPGGNPSLSIQCGSPYGGFAVDVALRKALTASLHQPAA